MYTLHNTKMYVDFGVTVFKKCGKFVFSAHILNLKEVINVEIETASARESEG